MNLENILAPTLLACLETTIFACLSSTEGFSFSVRPADIICKNLLSCATPAQRATALDILDLLHSAACKCLAKQPYFVQEELLLDRETCGRLLAFLHCNSLIDCSKQSQGLRAQTLNTSNIWIFCGPIRASRFVGVHFCLSPSTRLAASSLAGDAYLIARQ